MHSFSARKWVIRVLVVCPLFCVSLFECHSEQSGLMDSSALSSLTAEEAREGVYVFYTQSFVDKENKRASYHGSIYGALQKFELKECELHIESVIVDRFAGTVDQRPTGDLQDTYRYSASFTLTPEIANRLALIEARPAQLERTTNSVCEEDSSCRFRWLQIQAGKRVIHEISTVNDSTKFNGQIDHFVFPISSSAIGNRLIEELRTIAGSRCH